MKITDIKLEKVRIELTAPFRVAFAEINYSENLLIKVSTDEGIDGYGEAAPLDGKAASSRCQSVQRKQSASAPGSSDARRGDCCRGACPSCPRP